MWRWRSAEADGPAALIRRRPGPRGPSKLTPALRTEVDTLRTRGASIAVIAERLGVSTFTVRAALGRPPVGVVAGGTGAGAADPAGGDADADADGDTGTPGEAQIEGGAADLTDDDVDNDRGDEPDGGDTQAEVQEIEVAAVGSVDAVGGEALLPVLPDPVDRRWRGSRPGGGCCRTRRRCSRRPPGCRWPVCSWRCPRWRRQGCWRAPGRCMAVSRTGSTVWT